MVCTRCCAQQESPMNELRLSLTRWPDSFVIHTVTVTVTAYWDWDCTLHIVLMVRFQIVTATATRLQSHCNGWSHQRCTRWCSSPDRGSIAACRDSLRLYLFIWLWHDYEWLWLWLYINIKQFQFKFQFKYTIILWLYMIYDFPFDSMTTTTACIILHAAYCMTYAVCRVTFIWYEQSE